MPRPNPARAPLLAAALLLAACGGSSAELNEAPAPSTPEAAPAPSAPETPQLDLAQLKAGSDDVALVPSPMETQRALEAAGIETQLASLIPAHDFDLGRADTDQAAVRTGVILADTLLTVKSADKAQLVARLDLIRQGMTQLGGGDDIANTLEDLKQRVQADAVTRDELLKEFDELSGAVIPELEFSGNDRVVPMIEAGSWLEGANLVARAVKAAEDPSAADPLLKQPDVVAYFARYVQADASGEAAAAMAQKLQASLVTLQTLAAKPEPLTTADLDVVIAVTGDVLALL